MVNIDGKKVTSILERNKRICKLIVIICRPPPSFFFIVSDIAKNNTNFCNLSNKDFVIYKEKFLWLMPNEDNMLLTKLTQFLINFIKIRNKTV